ncbi:hypothetical protein V12B01_13270 [Vibrio splendidus 12B01]|nr:hypothetical protein V12B01_13270 [Vibrio splendidus 12B01]
MSQQQSLFHQHFGLTFYVRVAFSANLPFFPRLQR